MSNPNLKAAIEQATNLIDVRLTEIQNQVDEIEENIPEDTDPSEDQAVELDALETEKDELEEAFIKLEGIDLDRYS